ncbi:hypothetical protein N7V09_12980 [Shewanella seohaensis]|nr:hypothetical protein [Shewanella seohaensis]UXM80797.1 hypothetical protein N7V09_12980 [Shewanella seohaensis]
MSLILELKQISKHYPGVKALEDVSLRLFAGKFTPYWAKTVRVNRRW